MKLITTGIFILILTTALCAQESVFKMENLGWISGCWTSENKDTNSSVSEFWTMVAGESMLGVGRTIKNGKTVDYEYLRIALYEKGIFYVAKPKANAEETPFRLTKLTPSEAVFENPAHDFPQKIIYRRDGTNLFARVEGNNKGKFMGFDFSMSKAKCD
jgi:hypothetical protein